MSGKGEEATETEISHSAKQMTFVEHFESEIVIHVKQGVQIKTEEVGNENDAYPKMVNSTSMDEY
jgi:hypothetical protein